jgi:hypothetical protein
VTKITLNISSSSYGSTNPSHHLLDEKTLRFVKKTLTEAYGNAVQVKVVTIVSSRIKASQMASSPCLTWSWS